MRPSQGEVSGIATPSLVVAFAPSVRPVSGSWWAVLAAGPPFPRSGGSPPRWTTGSPSMPLSVWPTPVSRVSSGFFSGSRLGTEKMRLLANHHLDLMRHNLTVGWTRLVTRCIFLHSRGSSSLVRLQPTPSRSHPALTPRTAPASAVHATCTATLSRDQRTDRSPLGQARRAGADLSAQQETGGLGELLLPGPGPQGVSGRGQAHLSPAPSVVAFQAPEPDPGILTLFQRVAPRATGPGSPQGPETRLLVGEGVSSCPRARCGKTARRVR